TGTTNFTASSLTPSTSYEWQVQTNCTGGSSSFTSSVVFTTGSATCTTPTGINTSSITNTTALFSWTAVPGAVNYNFQYRVLGDPNWTWTGWTTTNSYNASLLAPGTTYEWQVQTVCSGGGTSPMSGSIIFTTTTLTCGLPTGMNTTSITLNSAAISWNAVSGAISYNIQYRQVG